MVTHLETSELLLRPLGEADVISILEVYRQCEDFLSLGPVPVASQQMVLADLELSRQQGGQFYGIYTPNDGLVGVVDFVRQGFMGSRSEAYLELLMLAEPYRRGGLGAKVVRLVEEEVRRDPRVHVLRADVQVNHPQAIRFWMKNGFRITGLPELRSDQTVVYPLRRELICWESVEDQLNTLYLVRHGENVANLTKELSCRKVDYDLTEKGFLQARQTATALMEKNVQEIYASPLKRTRQTAYEIARQLDLPVYELEDLREVNVGDLEGQQPTEATWTVHNSTIASWFEGYPENAMPNGDHYLSLCKRFRRAVTTVVSGRAGKVIAIAGHGGMFTFALTDLCPDLRFSDLNGPNQNCSITELRAGVIHGQTVARLVRWGDYSHLSGEAAKLVDGFIETSKAADNKN